MVSTFTLDPAHTVEFTPEQVAKYSCDKSIKRKVWLRREWRRKRTCHYCRGSTILPGRGEDYLANSHRYATVDHVVPTSKGGPDHFSNWVLACNVCNGLKADMDAKDFIRELEEAGIR